MKNIYFSLFITIFFLRGYSQPSCSGTDPGGNPAKPGLYAEYYAGYFNDDQTFFNSTVKGLTRIDSSLNYSTNDWGNITPPATGTVANPENYSARWRGSIYIAVAGTYTFYLHSDDASYMWLDDAAMASPPTTAAATINNGGLHSPATVTATVTLTAGIHSLAIHFGENTGQNRLVLEYSSPTIPQRVVPASILCTSFFPAPLPINLLAFNVTIFTNKKVNLEWSTATETNNDFFTIERSKDAINFEIVKQLPGAGNSTCVKRYNAVDESPLSGTTYYRLKQTDYNGNFMYSQIIPITVESSADEISIYPNPSSGTVNLLISSSADQIGRAVKVMSFLGKTIYSTTLNTTLFNYELNLTTGNYILIVTNNDGSVTTKKIIVN